MSVEFQFRFKGISKNLDVTCQVPIPLLIGVREFAFKITDQRKLPFYVEESFVAALEEFVANETDKYYGVLSDRFMSSDFDEENIVDKWSTKFQEEHVEYSISDDEKDGNAEIGGDWSLPFANMYHSLIHSSALDTMLNLEHTYALCMEELVQQRDHTITQLQKKLSQEMEKAIEKVGILYSDKDINSMAGHHFEENQRVADTWDRKIKEMKETQKREFCEWITKVHEDYSQSTPSPTLWRPHALSEGGLKDIWIQQPQRMEESFTIHLGSQLKVMHNLRLLSTDILDLCRHKANRIGGVLVPQPQRLQTAISLYSNRLSGLVLLVDNRINSYTGLKRDFANVCQQSTEFHFPELEDQLENIRLRRLGGVREKADQGSSAQMNLGDFYITRHSNLSEVHVVFHLVVDDSLRSCDINSRHPVILGLRNVLRVAHERDICTITLPLLLVHEMSEEMTIPWCMKRAELVFKCLKGFMIEIASLMGEETRTVQFLIPKDISEELFLNLSAMLPSIFRVSNPLVLKSR